MARHLGRWIRAPVSSARRLGHREAAATPASPARSRRARRTAKRGGSRERRTSAHRHERTIILGLIGVIVLAVGAWVVGTRIRSPAQIAAETAAPLPSVITVPVERRVLSTEVVVRGTVRYGAPQSVTLATSSLKQQGGDIVSQPPKLGATLNEGSLAMSVGGRPVFVAVGALPMNRDLSPGSVGADVRQLEQALARLGFSPGAVDDRYDSATAGAVSAWYQKQGWAPFGPTDAQAEQLRVATASAA